MSAQDIPWNRMSVETLGRSFNFRDTYELTRALEVPPPGQTVFSWW